MSKERFQTLFKRSIALSLTLAFLLTPCQPSGIKTVKAADEYLPVTSAEVDDSTESGRILKEILLYEESRAGLKDTQSVPFADWGEGLTGEAWALAETKAMVPVEMIINKDSLSEEAIAELEGEGYAFDAEGNLNISQKMIDELMELGLENICTVAVIDDVISWGVGKVMDWLFGCDDSSIEDALKEINAKVGDIKNQMDVMDKKLDQILGALEAKKYRDDLATANTARAALHESVENINLNMFKTNDIKDVNQKIELRKGFTQDINEMQIDGNSFYVALMKYSDILTERNNHSGKNIFEVAYYITIAGHFPWDHQEATYFGNMTNYYMGTYMQALAYSRLSLMYQASLHPVGSRERINYETIYERLLSGNKQANVTSKAQKMLAAVQNAPRVAESPYYAVLNKNFSGYDRNHWYIRETNFNGNPSGEGYSPLSKDEATKWIDFINHPSRHNVKNVNMFFSNVLAHSMHLQKLGIVGEKDGLLAINAYILSDGSFPEGDEKGYPSFKEDEKIFGTKDLYTVYKDLAKLSFSAYDTSKKEISVAVSRSRDGKNSIKILGSSARRTLVARHAEYDLKTGEFVDREGAYKDFWMHKEEDGSYSIDHNGSYTKEKDSHVNTIMVVKDYYGDFDDTEKPSVQGIVTDLDIEANTFTLVSNDSSSEGIKVSYDDNTSILIANKGAVSEDLAIDEGDEVEVIYSEQNMGSLPNLSGSNLQPATLAGQIINHALSQRGGDNIIYADAINLVSKGYFGNVGFVIGTVAEISATELLLVLPEDESRFIVDKDTIFIGVEQQALKAGDTVGVGYVQQFVGGGEIYRATSIEFQAVSPDDPMPGPVPNPTPNDDPMPGPLPNPEIEPEPIYNRG